VRAATPRASWCRIVAATLNDEMRDDETRCVPRALSIAAVSLSAPRFLSYGGQPGDVALYAAAYQWMTCSRTFH